MVFIGGLERMLFEALRAARDHGAAAHCLVNSWESEKVAAEADAIGATWSVASYREPLRRPRKLGPVLRLLRDMTKTTAAVLRAGRRFKLTHVLVPEFGMVLYTWPAFLWYRLRRVPVVLALQNAPAEGRFYRFVWRWLVNPAVDRFVCASDACRRTLLAHGIAASKLTVVFNFAPPRDASAASEAPRDFRKILFVGQLIPGKGLDILLDALGVLASRGRDLRLDVVGKYDGWIAPEYVEFRQRLRTRAEANDLRERVRFLGWRNDIPALMKGAAVLCVPSRPEMYEGFGIVIVEAKQAGLPAVTFDVGPFPELIAHSKDGWICRELTADALADTLDRALADRAALEAMVPVVVASAQPFSADRFRDGWWRIFADHAVADASRTVAGSPVSA